MRSVLRLVNFMRARRITIMVATLALCAGVLPARAQQGDRAGEPQPDLPESLVVPDAPVLSPEEALAAFEIKDGFRIELVASEPLIEDPVAIAFDPDGRIWVVEMRGFMPNIDGTNELDPVGRIVVLKDEDGDGRMDTSTVFLDHLVLPRAISLAYGGALVIQPPDLLFYRDRSGDGRADSMRHLYTGFAGLDSPEHAGNGLLRGLDNWIYCSQHPLRFRFDGEEVQTQKTPGHGQWGISQDDVGRLYYTTNSNPLRGDHLPLHYASRNPNLPRLVGVNEQITSDFNVWPIRVTPGVNRAYQKNFLRDGKLKKVTGACGPVIYRDSAFPAEFRGNAFICEPAANLVKRCVLKEDANGRTTGRAAYPDSEFLASTDERFRPVNAYTGPDGGLYIVDMYRGILQHRVFMTSFLRKQVLERELDKPIGLGRIYRIVHEDMSPADPPHLSTATNAELVDALNHTNGWWRDTAQRLLVERKALDATASLRESSRTASRPVTVLHALWTLEGLGAIQFEDAALACRSTDAQVRRAGIRLMERWLDEPRGLDVMQTMFDDEAPLVRGQAALSLGESSDERAGRLLQQGLTAHTEERQIRSAVISGLRNRELPFLRSLLADETWSEESAGRTATVTTLVDCIQRSGSKTALSGVLELAVAGSDAHSWQADAILKQVAKAQRLTSKYPVTLQLDREPEQWTALTAMTDALGNRAAAMDPYLTWPGRPVVAGRNEPRELTDADRALIGIGERLYTAVCVSCHLPTGAGSPGQAPPLAGSEWVLGPERRLARILLHGMAGPLEIEGMKFDGSMPKSPFTSDQHIAALLSYVRRSWGNNANPIAPDLIAEVRTETKDRVEPWTAAELQRVR